MPGHWSRSYFQTNRPYLALRRCLHQEEHRVWPLIAVLSTPIGVSASGNVPRWVGLDCLKNQNIVPSSIKFLLKEFKPEMSSSWTLDLHAVVPGSHPALRTDYGIFPPWSRSQVLYAPRFVNREFKTLPRLLQRRRHFKIELCGRSSALRPFHVGHVVRNKRIVLSFAWHQYF